MQTDRHHLARITPPATPVESNGYFTASITPPGWGYTQKSQERSTRLGQVFRIGATGHKSRATERGSGGGGFGLGSADLFVEDDGLSHFAHGHAPLAALFLEHEVGLLFA
jgi:hypothetical protein